MTEDSLVAALRDIVEAPASASVPGRRKIVAGIGDDAAVWQPSRSHLSVITTDALVEGVHFTREMAPAAIGHRAMAANLSDVAAMGARPVLVTVLLGVAAGCDPEWILECYRGMAALATRHRARIVGGDIVRSPVASLGLTVVGEVARARLKRRSGGLPGDVLAVTGPLGASRAGLEVLRGVTGLPDAVREAARRAFELPEPRVSEGRWLAASVHVRAMMDSSDGLSTDLARLALASGCGATVDDVPVAAVAEAVAAQAEAAARSYALDGGEDFELIAAIAPRAFTHLAQRFAAHFGKPLLRIGVLDARPGIRLLDGAAVRVLVAAGYDHLGAPHQTITSNESTTIAPTASSIGSKSKMNS